MTSAAASSTVIDLPAEPSWRLIERYAFRRQYPLTGFRRGWFIVFHDGSAYAIRLCPEPQIWMTNGKHAWQRCMAKEQHFSWYDFRLTKDPNNSPIQRQSDGSWLEPDGQMIFPSLHPLWIWNYWNQHHHEQLEATLSEPIRAIFSQLKQEDSLSVLSFLLSSKAACELLSSNPGLGYLLATSGRYRKDMTTSKMVTLASRPQKQILEELGLPPSEHLRLLLMRLSLSEITREGMDNLRLIVGSTGWLDLLMQVDKLNAEVLKWLSMTNHWSLFTPRLIADVAATNYEKNPWDMSGLTSLVDAAAHGLWTPRPLQSLHHYRNQVKILRQRLRQHFIYRILPPPPCPGDSEVVPLTTAEEVIEEGVYMEHCLGSTQHIVDSLQGKAHYFKVLTPQRGTAEIRKSEDGYWQLEGYQLASNQEPGAMAIVQLEQKFSSWLAGEFQCGFGNPCPFETDEIRYFQPQAV